MDGLTVVLDLDDIEEDAAGWEVEEMTAPVVETVQAGLEMLGVHMEVPLTVKWVSSRKLQAIVRDVDPHCPGVRHWGSRAPGTQLSGYLQDDATIVAALDLLDYPSGFTAELIGGAGLYAHLMWTQFSRSQIETMLLLLDEQTAAVYKTLVGLTACCDAPECLLGPLFTCRAVAIAGSRLAEFDWAYRDHRSLVSANQMTAAANAVFGPLLASV